MKRLLALLITIIMICTLWGCAETHKSNSENTTVTKTETVATSDEAKTEEVDKKESDVTPLLYKISDENGNCVWLLGTIHIGKDSFYPLPDYVLDAYNGAEALAVECDINAFENDLEAQTAAIMPLLYLDNTKIFDYVSEEVYETGVEVMTELGFYNELMDFYKPIMWYSYIENAMTELAGGDYDLGIDQYFLDNAYDTGKEILEVESVQFQYELLANYSDKLQALLLEDILYAYKEELDIYNEDINELMNMWARGDEEELTEYMNAEPQYETYEERMLYEEYNSALVTDRNIDMADFAEEMLKNGKEVFICVGAAHVIGNDAMVELLTQRGYTVEIVR